MPKDTIRISLNAAQFPLLYRDMPRTVIVPGLDVNTKWPSYFGNQDNADWGNPQMTFCENVLPIANGYVSTKFTEAVPTSTQPSFQLVYNTPGIGASSQLLNSSAADGTLTNFTVGTNTGYTLTRTSATAAYQCNAIGYNALPASATGVFPGGASYAHIAATSLLATTDTYIGLTSQDPTTAVPGANFDFAIRLSAGGVLTCEEAGAVVFTGAYAANDKVAITIDATGVAVIYWKNGAIIFSDNNGLKKTLFGVFMIKTIAGSLYNCIYNPKILFDQIIVMRDGTENNSYLSPAGGQNILLTPQSPVWGVLAPGNGPSFTPSGQLITSSNVQGSTFVFYEKERLFQYNFATLALTDVTASLVLPAGFTLAMIRGIGGASNYNLLFTDITILWSSPSDPLNFNRALNNGSGFQIPQDIKGPINSILPISGGAIAYSLRGAVGITFTNNAAAPFVFRGVSNCGGTSGEEQIAHEASDQFHYIWSTGGLQKVNLNQAIGVFPEVTDFLASNWYETYDYTNHLVSGAAIGSSLSVKLTGVAQRYLVISYGVNKGTYTYALIFDTVAERWGKLKITHTDCFTFSPAANSSPVVGGPVYSQIFSSYANFGELKVADLTASGALTPLPVVPKGGLAFLQFDGTIQLAYSDYNPGTAADKSVIIIGRIQHDRARMCTLHQVEVEGLDESVIAPRLFDLLSVDGKQITEVREYLAYDVTPDATYNNYLGDACGKTHQIVFEGAFQLTSLVMQLGRHGRAV